MHSICGSYTHPLLRCHEFREWLASDLPIELMLMLTLYEPMELVNLLNRTTDLRLGHFKQYLQHGVRMLLRTYIALMQTDILNYLAVQMPNFSVK